MAWAALRALTRPTWCVMLFGLCSCDVRLLCVCAYMLRCLQYLDMVKRGVANVLYQDTPRWFYGSDKTPRWAARFILSKRRHGDDVPSQAHSMYGCCALL